jgi:hypothetical protein
MVEGFFSRLTKGLFSVAIPLGTLQVESRYTNAIYWPPWGHHSLPCPYTNLIGCEVARLLPVIPILFYTGANIVSAVAKRPKDQSIRETLKYIFNPFYDTKVEIVEDEIDS